MLLNKPGGEVIGSAEEVVDSFVTQMRIESFLHLGRVGQKFARVADTADELELLELYMKISQAKKDHQSWINL